MQLAKRLTGVALSLAVLSGTFTISAPAFAAGITTGKTITVANTGGDNIRVRGGASTTYDVKASVTEGDKVTVLEGPIKDSAGHSWYRISIGTSGSHIGWIDARYLTGGVATTTKSSTSASTSTTSTKATAVAFTTGSYAKVANTNGDSLRVRSTAGGKIVASIAPSTVLSIKAGPTTDKQGVVWYQVSGSGVSGWVHAEYLVKTTKPATTTASTTTKTSASTAKTSTTTAKTSSTTAKTSTSSTTTTAAARDGVSRGTVAVNSSGSSIVSMAMKYVGSNYRYAGTTPAGFDCSGFVYYVYNKVGIGLSRSMSAQIAAGTKISSSQLQPGDLVYFANTYKSGISHIAIYAGNGKIVHAADYGIGVTVSDLWSPYWVAHYAGAVRIRG